MRWRAAIDSELQKLQLLLPFAEEKTIDTRRCCSILHIQPPVLARLRVTPLMQDGEEMCLRAYNTSRGAPLRIDYQSLLRFVDYLRELHAIPDRRPPKIFGRHRDEDLLPFPWSDTMFADEAADVLDVHPATLRNYVEEGRFESYQIARGSDWRISRNSFARYLGLLGAPPKYAHPYGSNEAASEADL